MNTLRLSTFAPLCLLLSLASAGCDDSMEDGMDTAGAETEGAETEGAGEIDEAAVLAMASDFASLTQVSDVPEPSQHTLADTVTFYAAEIGRASCRERV